jgi:hypothetical protein
MTVDKMLVEGFKIEAVNGIKLKKIQLIKGTDFLKSDFRFTYHVNLKNGAVYSTPVDLLSRTKELPSKMKNCTEIFFREDEEFECSSINFEFQNLDDQKIMLTFEML